MAPPAHYSLQVRVSDLQFNVVSRLTARLLSENCWLQNMMKSLMMVLLRVPVMIMALSSGS